MPNDCSRELYEYLKRQIQKVIDGYQIVSQEADGCDEYGIKYWVECKNGWTGREWDVREACFYGHQSYLNRIVKDGIMFQGTKHYIHPDIVFSQNQFMTLTPEEYNDYQQITHKLETIRDKICQGHQEYMKDKSYWTHSGPWYYGLKDKLYCTSIENFRMSLIGLVSTNYTNLVIDEFRSTKMKIVLKWGKLEKEEIELLGYQNL